MRTDVKVGIICAFAIVLCVVIYFVARNNAKRPPTPEAPGQSSLLASRTDPTLPEPGIPVASAPGSGVGGGLIGLPSTMTPAPSSLGIPTPGMGPTLATSGAGTPTVTGPMFGAPMTFTPPPGASTPAALTSGLPTTGTPTPAHSTMVITSLPGLTGTPSLALPASPTTYKIQQGDMLYPISKKYNVTVDAIKAANPGIDSSHLKINAVIKIPAPVAVATPHTATPGAITPATPTTPHVATPATPRTAVAASTSIKPGTTYTVKKGDTLMTIAKAAYGSKTDGWKKIFRANLGELTDPDDVPVGTKIVIPQ